jgi:hypothetical protein
MGTNFFLESTAKLPTAFGRPRLHIGKSSAGWCFALRVYPKFLCDWPEDTLDGVSLDDHQPVNLGQWLGLMEATAADGSARIVDDYGRVLSLMEIRSQIMDRSWPRKAEYPNTLWVSEAEFHRTNQSAPGPNGLVRHQIDGRHCIAHGDGTWDLIVGEFS